MKAIFNHHVYNEDVLLHLNWFMIIVEMSEYPVDLIRNLYQEGMLPDGLKDTDCEVEVTPERVSFYETINGNERELIAYTTLHKIDM